MAGSCFYLLSLVLLFAGEVRCTHFRGAILQYRPVNPDNFNGVIEIRHRIAWRGSYSFSPLFCDQSTITNRNLRGSSSDYLRCRVGCRGNLGNMQYYCTDFSSSEDWSAGERTYTVDLSGLSHFEASFQGNAWISLQIGGGRWEVRLKGNLTQRPDTGTINTSPITTATPILRLQHGCNHTFSIPVEDADGDTIRCRWASSSLGECAGVCNAFPATLTEEDCTLRYEATGRTGLYVVALQVEDFASPTDTIPLSSIPLQFIVSVFVSTEACTSLPEFVPPTRVDRSCIAVPFNTTYDEVVTAQSGNDDISITDIITASPSGLVHSELYQAMVSRQWSINVTWLPLPDQAGPNIFCYHAIDSARLSSPTTCVTLVVGVRAPTAIPNSMRPTGTIFPNFTSDWTIDFDKQFYRTSRSRYISIYDSNGQLVERMNAAFSNNVMYPTGTADRTLRFRPQFTLIEKMNYFVILDPGVVVGPEFCNPESPALYDPSIWVVSIADVTPPSLTFLENPLYSNRNVTISWSINEEASTTCTLQTPTTLMVVNCNYTLLLTNLREGGHTLYIQTVDVAGNIAPIVRHTWTVDLTPPVVRLTSTPSSVTNQTESRIVFGCVNEWRCSYMCAIYETGRSPVYLACTSPFIRGNLINGRTYTFSVVPTDGVGNIGPSRNHAWRIDLTPPVISNVNNVTINCGDDSTPTATGQPTVTDNEDINVIATYTDYPLNGCGLTRVWVAMDRAGNIALLNQSITFTNPQPPIVSTSNSIVVACANAEDVISNLASENITIRHPCNRPVTTTFRDSASIRCDFTFTRTWTISDDCGRSTLFIQTIRVLEQQFPDGPENGLVNAGLYETLSWPQFPGATSYRVFVWIAEEQRPSEPVRVSTSRSYTPSTGYPPGTRMLWQVEYILGDNMTVPSPVWGFMTEPQPDLEVTNVVVPSYAFSGQSFSVSWTVLNTGNLSVTRLRFDDAIFMGQTPTFSNSRRVKTVSQTRFVDVGDGYMSSTEINLNDDDIGLFYIFVYTDYTNRVYQDTDRTNNVRMSTFPLQVRLTPPPNLVVRNIATPSSVFSDTIVNVRWTVMNIGLGVTGVDRWTDRLYLSSDNQTDRNDYILRTVRHTGVLGVGSSYVQSESVTMPHAIYGTYYFIVVTDLYNSVYEHVSENDNRNTSQVEIILSPPPDLVVSFLEVNSSIFTGEQLVVTYTVTNEGAGPTFETQWRDYVVVRPVSSQRGPTYYYRRYGVLEAGNSYTVQTRFFILPSYGPGQYNVSVSTDYRNQVFELNSDGNNLRWATVTLNRRLPDLVISSFVYNVEATDLGNQLNVSYTVRNLGAGDTIGAPWRDEIRIVDGMSSQRQSILLNREVIRSELPSGSEYNFTRSFIMPSSAYGTLLLTLSIDSTNQIVEDNNNNNNIQSSSFSVAPLFPDLMVSHFRILSDPQQIIGGSNVELEWVVTNQGERIVPVSTWYDSFTLNSQTLASTIRLATVPVRLPETLDLGMDYQRQLNVTLPQALDYSIDYSITLEVNSRDQIEENRRTENNIVTLPIRITPPPSPDLQVEVMNFNYFSSSRLLTIRWTVRNIGNSMTVTQSWRDQVLLSSSGSLSPSAENFILGYAAQTLRLQADQAYTHQESYVMPSTTIGDLYVYVITDISNRVMEIDGEDNNVRRSDSVVIIAQPPVARFDITTNFDTLPVVLSSGQTITVRYTVVSNGQIAVGTSSWVDSIYLSDMPNPSRSYLFSEGLLVGQNINTMELLESGSSYSTEYNVTLPNAVIGQQYLVILIDSNNALNVQTFGTLESMVSIQQGPLPDIIVNNVNSSYTLRSGQPTSIEYIVTNIGESSASGIWYESVILSRDPYIDPFDVRLKTVSNPISTVLRTNESYSQNVDVFIPYDLPTSSYYIIVDINTRSDLFEDDFNNNEAHTVVSIVEAVSTDLAVVNVQLMPNTATYGDQLTYQWQLRNNGGILAQGYKCDSVYLSEDDEWDISDFELGRPICSSVRAYPFNNDSRNDRVYFLGRSAPFIAQQSYFGIVRTRSNIRDPNGANNIGSTASTINLNAPSLILDQLTNITLVPNDVKVFRIEGVSDEETLIATLSSEQELVYHDLYLRHNQAPTGAIHDAFSQFSLSSFQQAVVRHTRSGNYYLRIESFTNSRVQGAYSANVLVKIARFEIMRITPASAAPLGNVTIKMSGTVLSYYSSAYLVSTATAIAYKAQKLYWFNSESVYATFDISEMELGNYSVRLVNDYDGQIAQLNNSFSVLNGINGQLSVVVERTRALRAGEVGDFVIQVQNIGNTDLYSPHIILTGAENVLFSLVDDSEPINFSNQIDFLGLPLEGPGGILPPGVVTQVNLRLKQEIAMPQRAGIYIRVPDNESAPHAYLSSKSLLKLDYIPDDVWDVIWNNFLSSVGTTQGTFLHRLSEIATEMSLVRKKAYSVDRIVRYQLEVAYGLLSGNQVFSVEDLYDVADDSSFPLSVIRTYSAFIHKRRTVGPMGVGWLLNMWELHVENVTSEFITLMNERERRTFIRDEESEIFTLDAEEIVLTTEGIQYFDNSGILIYLFDMQSGKIKSIQGLVYNVTLNFHYVNNQLQSIENSNSLKRLNVSYTDNGRIQSILLIGADGNTEQTNFYNYDPSGMFLLSVISGQESVQYTYNEDGDLIRIIKSDGTSNELDYNENGFISSVRDFDRNAELIFQYDYEISWNGRMDIQISPLNSTGSIVHDLDGNIVSIADSTGLPEIYQELPFGRRILFGDEVILENRIEGQTTYAIDQKGIQNIFVRSDEGRIVLFEDGDGYQYTFTYDENGLQTGFGFPDGTSTSLSYDDEGHLATLTNPDESSITYSYDDEDNLIRRSHAFGETFFEYNSRRLLLSATNENGRISISYDNRDRPIEVNYHSSGYTLYYGYNEQNLRLFIADNHGYNISYVYDAQSRLSEVRKSEDRSLVAAFEYEGNFLKKKTLGNGAYSVYSYDSQFRLESLVNYYANDTVSSSNYYQYDLKGRVTRMINSANESYVYKYDALGQVTGWTSSTGEVVEFTYDNRGNRLVKENNGIKEHYRVNEMNQYLAYNETQTFEYDQNGNLVEKNSLHMREAYRFNPEGRLVRTETMNNRCTYHYDAFGNLNTKNCTDRSQSYLVDPFGAFGSDIIGEINHDETTYFIYASTNGLLASLGSNGQSDYYYEFNLDGAVEKLFNHNGAVLNSYKYDIFGKLTYSSEEVRNIFKYSGLLGVIQDEELRDIYMIRARHYDAEHGRFISLDPIGINGKSSNYYVYVLNNPIVLKDPTGLIIPALAVRAVIGAAVSTTVHVLTTPSDEITIGSIGGAAVNGAVSGALGVGKLSKLPNIAKIIIPGLARDLTKYGIDGNFNGKELVRNVAYDVIWGYTGRKLFSPLTKIFEDALGSTGFAYGTFRERLAKSVFKKIYDNVLDDYFKSENYENARNWLQDKIDELKREAKNLSKNLKNLLAEIAEWIRARDPNDIIGPAGFGDAHFISPEMRLDYRIRFENDPNATAPAQRVFIRCILDEDLDTRSFRIGSFGFGDFVRNVTTSRSILQENINLTSSLGVFVRVRAGLDIIRREASWEFQTLDPLTGQEPLDPSIGFLPPNNITSGQGFVTFSIFADNSASNLARIDAEASIIFDANEPIDTPPIFNTIDKIHPEIDLTVNDELLDTNVLAVNLNKTDSGSGVKNVDLYRINNGTGEVMPVVRGSTDNIVILPLNEGTHFTLFSSSVDNVGNRKPLALSMQDSVKLEFPIVGIQCPNNCTSNGNCTVFGVCVCEAGHFGNDCSQDSPPPEPPILEIPQSVSGEAGQPISVQIAAIIPGQNSLDGLEVLVDNVPQGSMFNRGRQVQDTWVFEPADFGSVELSLPSEYSGELSLDITAMAAGVSRQRSLIIIVAQSNVTNTSTTTSVPNVSEFTLNTTAYPNVSEYTRNTDDSTPMPYTSDSMSTANISTYYTNDSTSTASTNDSTPIAYTNASTVTSASSTNPPREGVNFTVTAALILFGTLCVLVILFLLATCIILVCVCVCCCKPSKKKRRADDYDIEMTETLSKKPIIF